VGDWAALERASFANRDPGSDGDRRALPGQLTSARFDLAELRMPFRDPMFYSGFGNELDVSACRKRRYAPVRPMPLIREMIG
jgi:hypothetical protein